MRVLICSLCPWILCVLGVTSCDSSLPRREESAGDCFKATDCADSTQVRRNNQCVGCIDHSECASQLCDTYGDLPGGGVGKCLPSSSAIYVHGGDEDSLCMTSGMMPTGTMDAPLCDIKSALDLVKSAPNQNQIIRVLANGNSYLLPPIDASFGMVRLIGPGFQPHQGATLIVDDIDGLGTNTFTFHSANVLIDGFLFSGDAIAASGGQITIRRSKLDFQNAGIRFDSNCTATLDRNQISDGTLGLTFDTCTVNMTNSILFQNNVDMINNFLNLNGGKGTFQFNTVAFNINMSTAPVAPIVNCGSASGIIVQNSIFVQNGTTQAIAQSCHTTADSNVVGLGDSDSGQLKQDPVFSDAANFDLRLNPLDATNQQFIIDRAQQVSASDKNVDHDYSGAPRPQGNSYDIGAFEAAPSQ